MKKNIVLMVLLGFLIVMNGILLFLVVKKPDRKHRPPKEFITERLNFNEDQIIKFGTIDEAHHRKMRTIDGESRKLKEILFSDVGNDAIKIDSIAGLIGSLAKERELEVHDYFEKIEKICDDKQKLKLRRIVAGALKPRPPGGGPPHDGPPPPR